LEQRARWVVLANIVQMVERSILDDPKAETGPQQTPTTELDLAEWPSLTPYPDERCAAQRWPSIASMVIDERLFDRKKTHAGAVAIGVSNARRDEHKRAAQVERPSSSRSTQIFTDNGAANRYRKCINSSDVRPCWLVSSRPRQSRTSSSDGTSRYRSTPVGRPWLSLRIRRLGVRVPPGALGAVGGVVTS
jgi:hypothetical protein